MEMTKKMANLKPELDSLQKKYGNNQELLVKEQMALYKRVGYNPVGCLGSLVPQILVLYVMIQVINIVTTNQIDPNTIYFKDWLQFPYVEGKFIFPDDFTKFFMLDLSKGFNEIGYNLNGLWYFVLAILVGLVQYISTKFMQVMQAPNTPKKKKKGEQSPEDMQAQMMNSMNTIFPLMTIFITLITPAVLGLYWLVQSLMLVVQYFIMDKEKSIKALKDMVKIDYKFNKNK